MDAIRTAERSDDRGAAAECIDLREIFWRSLARGAWSWILLLAGVTLVSTALVMSVVSSLSESTWSIASGALVIAAGLRVRSVHPSAFEATFVGGLVAVAALYSLPDALPGFGELYYHGFVRWCFLLAAGWLVVDALDRFMTNRLATRSGSGVASLLARWTLRQVLFRVAARSRVRKYRLEKRPLHIGCWYAALVVALLAAPVLKFGLHVPLVVTLGAAAFAYRRARKHSAVEARELLEQDERDPVVYLRPFGEEFLVASYGAMSKTLPFGSSLEEQLVADLNLLGPVVAISDPGRGTPLLGAARQVVPERWQDAVTDWIRTSVGILVLVGPGEGLRWELSRVHASNRLDRTLLLFPQDFWKRLTELRWSWLEDVLGIHAVRAVRDLPRAPILFAALSDEGPSLVVRSRWRLRMAYRIGMQVLLERMAELGRLGLEPIRPAATPLRPISTRVAALTGFFAVSLTLQPWGGWQAIPARLGVVSQQEQIARTFEERFRNTGDGAPAMRWWEAAADSGSPRAAERLGRVYWSGDLGVTAAPDRAVGYLNEAADRGSSLAARLLGTAYENGRGVERDLSLAENWYTRSATAGDPEAQHRLGHLLEDESRFEEALRWFRECADQGESECMFDLGNAMYLGQGTDTDLEGALHWLVQAGSKGHANARFLVHRCYEREDSPVHDPVLASRWLERAAEAGHSRAQYLLGLRYAKGDRVDQDAELAASWYEKAAKSGSSEAMNNLGVLIESNPSLGQDREAPVHLYRRSAERGNATGMYNLARCLERGVGVPPDPAEALEWYRRSAESGNEHATEALKVRGEE